jgi:hypothetical protein
MVIAESGSTSAGFPITVVRDNVHILTNCDSLIGSFLQGAVCKPVVTHVDGTLVTAFSPGRPGEEIVVYALGLGGTAPPVSTGQVTPVPPPLFLEGNLYIQFDFRPNAAPSLPYYPAPTAASAIPVADFVGLTPGQVGLYQINIRLPDTFPTIPSCTLPTISFPEPAIFSVDSNLTIDVSTGVTAQPPGTPGYVPLRFDGAAICVVPSN